MPLYSSFLPGYGVQQWHQAHTLPGRHPVLRLQAAWAFANLSSTSRQTSVAHDGFGQEPSVQLNNRPCFTVQGDAFLAYSPSFS